MTLRGRPVVQRLPSGNFREVCRFCGRVVIWRIPELPRCCEDRELMIGYQRVRRSCATEGCRNPPELCDPFCLRCQLEGRAPDLVPDSQPRECIECREAA